MNRQKLYIVGFVGVLLKKQAKFGLKLVTFSGMKNDPIFTSFQNLQVLSLHFIL